MIFYDFVEIKGKAILECGDEAQLLQRSTWGKIGDCIDALKQVRWVDQTGEELRSAMESQGFSLN